MCVAVATGQRHAPNVHAVNEVDTLVGNIATVIVSGAVVHAMLEQRAEREDLKKVCMYIGICDEQSCTIVSTSLL